MTPNSIGAFLLNTVRENKNPEAMWINFKSISTWRPNVVVTNTATHKQVNFLTPPKGSVKKKTLKIDSKGHAVESNKLNMTPNGWFNHESANIKPWAMFIDFKSIQNMSPETQKLWFLLQSRHIQNIFLKEMCQKSKMDTTIDFVKTQNTIPKK